MLSVYVFLFGNLVLYHFELAALNIPFPPLSPWLPLLLTNLSGWKHLLISFQITSDTSFEYSLINPPHPRVPPPLMCLYLLFCLPFHFLCSSVKYCVLYMQVRGRQFCWEGCRNVFLVLGLVGMLKRCECVCVGICQCHLSSVISRSVWNQSTSSGQLFFHVVTIALCYGGVSPSTLEDGEINL